MCNAWRHFIKDLRVGKKENEDDRMRSGGERDGRGGGRDEHLIGLPVTGQGKHKQSAVLPANAVSVGKTVLMQCAGMPIKSLTCLSKEHNPQLFEDSVV